jgi:hypothetical protein
MGKHEDGDFSDPVVRCAQCAKLVHRQYIDQHGGCNHCGNRRFSNVTGLSSDEYHALHAGRYQLDVTDYTQDDDKWLAWIQDWEPAS